MSKYLLLDDAVATARNIVRFGCGEEAAVKAMKNNTTYDSPQPTPVRWKWRIAIIDDDSPGSRTRPKIYYCPKCGSTSLHLTNHCSFCGDYMRIIE